MRNRASYVWLLALIAAILAIWTLIPWQDDALSNYASEVASWFVFATVVALAFEAGVRYAGRKSN
jgi:hypothetical protein